MNLEEQMQIKEYSSGNEKLARKDLITLLKKSPIPDDQLLSNLGLFLESKNLSRILFMNEIYKLAVNVQGIVMEFGTRWGQNMGLFSSLRGIYEPFNRHRKIVAFDTFEGFPEIDNKDGSSEMMKKGQLAVAKGYYDYLSQILQTQEALNPLSHLKKFELRKGDATQEIHGYLQDNPETIVALAYFDFDLYKPTRECLKAIKPRLTKGSVIGFDELNDPDSPGETLALMEEFGLNNIRIIRPSYASRVSYFVIE